VVVYINDFEDSSKTSFPQTWGIPSHKNKTPYPQGTTIADLYPPAKKLKLSPYNVEDLIANYSGINCPLINTLKAEMQTSEMKECKNVLNHILSSVSNNSETEFFEFVLNKLDIKSYLTYSANVQPTSEDTKFYSTKVCISKEKIMLTAQNTVTQAKSVEWMSTRCIRISSTKAHNVKTRKANFTKLAKDFLNEKSFSNANTEYGKRMEIVARKQFYKQNLSRVRVLEVGVIVSRNQPWICASPDGIIIEKPSESFSLLEIKCPSSRKNQLIVDYEKGISHLKYLIFQNNEISLNRKHNYYTQVQHAMYVTNLDNCHFVVHSSKQQVCILIPRDENFLSNLIPKLQKFYFKFLLPEIVKSVFVI